MYKKRHYMVCPIVLTKPLMRRFFEYQGNRLCSNLLNKNIGIYDKTWRDNKVATTKWLLSLGYDDTDRFLLHGMIRWHWHINIHWLYIYTHIFTTHYTSHTLITHLTHSLRISTTHYTSYTLITHLTYSLHNFQIFFLHFNLVILTSTETWSRSVCFSYCYYFSQRKTSCLNAHGLT